jgi:thymidylate synthase
MQIFENFTEAYVGILKDLYKHPQFTSSPRGMMVKEILGYQFQILNPRHRIPYVEGRDFSIHYMIAELLWYLSGNNSTDWISNYSTFWSKISDDGKTANSAYGARIFKHHEYQGHNEGLWTQWEYVKNELKLDPDSRRAVIHIRMPQDSKYAKLDVPCTLSLQFFLRNNKVHMVVSMRSSDVILGLAYDVPAFTIFQELLAVQLTQELGRPIGLGTYTHLSASLHVYERHFKMVEKILGEDWRQNYEKFLEMPAISSIPPIDKLMQCEKDIRKTNTANDLLNVATNLMTFDDYWTDWIRILVSHKALKLKENNLSNQLLLSTSFDGYKYFAKG